ncbi:MAG: DUF2877 domain-containing protein [Ktedonobacteraceae bacterium]
MRATSYSACIAPAAGGAPQRGVIHSVFRAAANISFPTGFMLSLNAASSPAMPNGLQLSSPAGSWPFSALRVGMPVLFGAHRLHIEAVNCSLDLTNCPRWDAHITRPSELYMHIIASNMRYLQQHLSGWRPQDDALRAPLLDEGRQQWRDAYASAEIARAMALRLCGRGIGLTPSGDDMLAGWMACNWLLHGPTPRLLEACQQIVLVARQQTHLLSQCWLSYAAEGNVALPIRNLLLALTQEHQAKLISAAQEVLSLGASSGYDVVQGMLLVGLHK